MTLSLLPTILTFVGCGLYIAFVCKKLGGERNLWIALLAILAGLIGYSIRDWGTDALWLRVLGLVVIAFWALITGFQIGNRFWVKKS